MLLPIYASMWLSGWWLPSGYVNPALVGNSLTDIFGTTIAVGSMVKLVGKVISVDNLSHHFHDIEVAPSYPQSNLVEPEAGQFPQTVPVKTYRFHPLQLIVEGGSL
jgi:hypothetical protein